MSPHEYLAQEEVVPPEAARWLEMLMTHDEGRRFAACLAIDVQAKALAPDFLKQFLAGLNGEFDDGLKALNAFAEAIKERRDELVCRSEHKGDALQNGDRYVRVLEIKKFTEFYLRPTLPVPSNPAGLQMTRRMLQKGLKLGEIRVVWRCKLPNVWVTSAAELDRLLDRPDMEHPGTVVNDALGLAFPDGGAPDGRPELLAVFYPPNYDIETYQPTVFDSPWDRDSYLHLFVAFGKKNSWGRTVSCTGNPLSCQERVHPAIEAGLTDGFEAEYIGVSAVLSRNIVRLVEEALRRFESGAN